MQVPDLPPRHAPNSIPGTVHTPTSLATLHAADTVLSSSYWCGSPGTEKLSVWCDSAQQSPYSNPSRLALEDRRSSTYYALPHLSSEDLKSNRLTPAQEVGEDRRRHVDKASLMVSKHEGNISYAGGAC